MIILKSAFTISYRVKVRIDQGVRLKFEQILTEEVERVMHERLGGRRYARLQTDGIIEALLDWACEYVAGAGNVRVRGNDQTQRLQCRQRAWRLLTQRVLDRGIGQVTQMRKRDMVIRRAGL